MCIYVRTCVTNIGDTLEMQNLTKSYMKTLKQDCNDLHELLLSANAVKFTEVIGEGMFSNYLCLYL